MNLLQIKVFVEASKYLNLTKVAENMYMSVPNVSKYISSLEDELGYPLMLREGKHLRLSEFGQAFFPHAEELLGKEDAIRDFLLRYRSNFHNTLTIYLSDSLVTTQFVDFYAAIAQTVTAFQNRHPDTLLRLRFSSLHEARMLQKEGKADVTIYSASAYEERPVQSRDLVQRELLPFRYYFVVPGNVDAANLQEAITRTDTLYYLDKPTARRVFQSLYDQNNSSSHVIALSQQGEIMMRIISGEGGGILSENAMQIVKDCGVKAFLLDPERYHSGLYAQYSSSSHHPDLQDFMQFLIQSFSQDDGSGPLPVS